MLYKIWKMKENFESSYIEIDFVLREIKEKNGNYNKFIPSA